MRSIVPAYVTEADHPWLRALLDEYHRFIGRRRREWHERTAQPLSVPAPRNKLRTALRVLERMSQDRVLAPVAPRQVRARVFLEAAEEPDRTLVLERASAELGIPPTTLLEALFADLPEERRLGDLREPLAPATLALYSNQALIAELLHQAARVRITARGRVRAVVRHVKLAGLLCVISPGSENDAASLEISGPYALFRHTRVYGRALASLVPRLAWCHDYRLEADCVLDRRGELGRLVIGVGDPLAAGRELRPFDSQVEQRFARDFARLCPEWDLVREPAPIRTGETLIFPDFELCRRLCPEDRWFLEIVGFWTPEYLSKKLRLLSRAGLVRLILCIDEDRRCAEGEVPAGARVVRYRRRVDPLTVRAIVNGDVPGP
jgi:predicted nuclease of restriction endonuclease-like RecB superfamily